MPAKKSAIKVAFGRAVREMREERGYTQESFAAHAGIDRSFYGAIERGVFNSTIDTLWRVADGLGVRMSEVLRRAGL